MVQELFSPHVLEDDGIDKKIFFSEREDESTTLTREELVNEIRRVTDLDAPVFRKLMEIWYLTKHYFIIDPNEGLPGIV